jgi:hypothetical protein
MESDERFVARVCDMGCEWYAQCVCDEVATWSETYDLGLSAPREIARHAAGIEPSEADEAVEAEEKFGFAHGEALCYEEVTEDSFVCYLLGREDEKHHVVLPKSAGESVQIRKFGCDEIRFVDDHPSYVARAILGLEIDDEVGEEVEDAEEDMTGRS